jgi:hypothetical protein
MLESSINLADTLGFAGKTIAVSPLGLKIIAAEVNVANKFDNIYNRLSELFVFSHDFKKYIDCIGGTDQMRKDIENKDVIQIARWLPFGYA